MKQRLSQDYDIDNRNGSVKRASDNTTGKSFLNRFVAQRRNAKRSDSVSQNREEQEEGRVTVSGPGDAMYSFKNAYGSPRSPAQRRLAKINQ